MFLFSKIDKMFCGEFIDNNFFALFSESSFNLCCWIYICSYQVLLQEQDMAIFKRNLTGLNSEFSFCTSSDTKIKSKIIRVIINHRNYFIDNWLYQLFYFLVWVGCRLVKNLWVWGLCLTKVKPVHRWWPYSNSSCQNNGGEGRIWIMIKKSGRVHWRGEIKVNDTCSNRICWFNN